jgi:uncharacterized repeat protein (TIGR03943 family)
MKTLADRWLPGVALFAWSFLLLYFHISGRIQAFLHPSFRPGVLLAGLVILLLGLAWIFIPEKHECCAEGGCGSEQEHAGPWRVIGLVIILAPVALGLSLQGDAFGTGTMLNRGIIVDAQSLKTAKPVRAAPASTQVEVFDLLYAVQDERLRAGFENRTVELIGQWMPAKSTNIAVKRFKVVRMFMVCCAADARPIAALVDCREDPGIPNMAWVKVTGTPTFPTENGKTIALVEADQVVVTDPPEETMLY